MKKIFSILILLTIFHLNTQFIHAFESFVPDSSNPLSVVSNYSGWNETGVMQSSIIFENGEYKMWYTSVGAGLRIAYATSSDGIHWQGAKLFDFLNGQDIHDPSMYRVGETYLLYFATTPSGEHTRIMKIESSNGVDFDASTLRTILLPELSWERDGVSSPTIYFENKTYFLFYTALNGNWKTGLATSSDGVNFSKCGNYFLDQDSVPKSFIKDGVSYYLFFHSPRGIEYVETHAPLSCTSQWINRTTIMSSSYFPFVFQKDNELMLYYGTPSGDWKLNLAISLNPLPTPTPTPLPKHPLILIPGMFASWNKEALFHNAQVAQSQWSMNPMVNEYKGIEQTLNNLGYVKNTDYRFFNYDWRQSAEKTADELYSYIQNKQYTQKPILIGHSLGGFISRIYLQKYGPSQINKVLTVGAPHGGTAFAYKPVEAGEIETGDTFEWLGQKMILQLYRNGIDSDKQIINSYFPIAQNLLPLQNYLMRDGTIIANSSLFMQNSLPLLYQIPNSQTLASLQTIAGDSIDTLSGYKLSNRSVMDRLLDIYVDGRPTERLTTNGDNLVINSSAAIGNNPIFTNLNHGELMYTVRGIKAILQAANISFAEPDVAESNKTQISPSLIFLMLSPAKLQVVHDNKTYDENEGQLFIENAQSGNYLLRVIGQEKGRYTIFIGQLGSNKDMWNRIEGEITQDPPTNQIDTYQIESNSQMPSFPLSATPALFDELALYLTDINKTLKKTDIAKSISNIKFAKQFYSVQNKGRLKSSLLLTHQQLFLAYQKSNINEKAKIFYAIEKLEEVYGKVLENYNFGIVPSRLSKSIAVSKKLISPLQNYLLQMKGRGKAVQKNALQLIEIEKRTQLAEDAMTQKKYTQAEIYIKSIQKIQKDVRNM
ncbi:hypothetical protein COY90_01900 [Candidatus Roizmanbacteria bacterium CG_4_10_14_0_8_um_filter_39_9]|uniref:PGAP1 family protein n=1 Tax=Candidatus Roizmanbacteria bacterium CG_4_10_14_0_8_um_filter_39_9 TaxID=1974829 RepID=A0A2M7QEC0_9BACT|nr:MAG: hypothetical protein COY90_01900 [Candidatus Roizmanbacteria bacterium CG_4_10_14_0_8_um_filter_39_9]